MNRLCLLAIGIGVFVVITLIICYFVKEKYSNERKLRNMRNERRHRPSLSHILKQRGLENDFPNNNNEYGPIGGRPGGITAL